MRIAVTGATGYIGGRLVPRLLDEGHDVVCLARNPGAVTARPWGDRVEVRKVDLLDAASVVKGLEGCDVGYYLVHSMGSAKDFRAADRQAAQNFSDAADASRLRRVLYLGGLGEDDTLSPHLDSRHEVGVILSGGATPCTELRAAVIIGSGSVSFEMLRYLTEVLPAMVTPTWVRTKCQPIAIRDVLAYLVAALDDHDGNHVYEIGGPDVLSYRDMMRAYAEVAGLPRRIIVPVPVLSPALSSLWIGLVTPLPTGVARPLVDSLRHEVVVRSDDATFRFPQIRPISLKMAIELALARSSGFDVETRWSDAASSPAAPFEWDPSWSGGTLFLDEQRIETTATPENLYWAFARIGGDTGYYVHNWAWRVRGLVDRIMGGVGLRRGRRHPVDVRLNDTVDFWRAVTVEPGRRLELAAEMRVPGRAWLEWRIEENEEAAVLHQTAYFRPKGLSGRIYWYAMFPFHVAIFHAMASAIARTAEDRPTH